MTQEFQKGELFGDGAGNPVALTVNMALSDSDPVWIGHQCDLVLRVDSVAGTAADALEFEIQDNPSSDDPAGAAPPPGAEGWLTVPVSYGVDSEGIRLQTAGIYRTTEDIDRFYVRVHHGTWIRFRARRVGGGVDTVLLITGESRESSGLESSLGIPTSQLTPPFVPYDGGYQALNIAAAAVLSAQLVVGEQYHIRCEAPCHWTTGGVGVVATAADYYQYAGETIAVPILDGADYISVIRDTLDSAGGFHISRAS